jgi:hypothetical protein
MKRNRMGRRIPKPPNKAFLKKLHMAALLPLQSDDSLSICPKRV